MTDHQVPKGLSRSHSAVLAALESLPRLREETGVWQDFELERQVPETLSYKRLDALSCFLATAPYQVLWQRVEESTKDWLRGDIIDFFNLVKEDGFYASPYSTQFNKQDQYVDMACDVLSFCCNLAVAYKSDRQLLKYAEEYARKSCDLLITEGHYFKDPEVGCVWSGTIQSTPVASFPSPHSSYFTSLFIIAICRAINNATVSSWLGEDRLSQAKALALEGCRYILAYAREGIVLPGSDPEEDLSNVAQFEKAVYTLWGLRALMSCEPWLDQDQITVMRALAKGLLDLANKGVSEKSFWHMPMSASGNPAYYEHRTSLGGLLSTLVEIRQSQSLKNLAEDISFNKTVNSIRGDIMQTRDSETLLWYEGSITIAALPTIISDLLSFGAEFREFDKELRLTTADLTPLVRRYLEDAKLLDVIARTVTDGLLSISENKEMLETYDRMKGDSPVKATAKRKKVRKNRKTQKS